jgi:hypothetical protein
MFISGNFHVLSIWVQKARIGETEKDTRRVADAIFQGAD